MSSLANAINIELAMAKLVRSVVSPYKVSISKGSAATLA